MDLLIFQVPILMVQASMDGILLGILFALIAYGMALQWGVMNIINIAQGDLVILGGYIAYFMYIYGIHPAWGVIVSPIIMYFVGIGIYKLVINKVVDRDLFISILATFGISILFMQLMNFAFGADVVLANSGYGTTMLFDNSVVLPNSKIFAATISIIFAIGLVVYMKKSKLGRAIRATAQNARAAKILGVDTEKVYAATFGINAALCGVAGALISITFTIHPYMGLPYTIRSFMIVIVAGLGNLPGVALSGMGLGVFEEFADYILGTEFRIGSVFLLLVLILVYRRFKLSKKKGVFKMINKNLIIYLLILIFGLAAPFIFPAFKVQLSILCVLIILAITWNIQGGEMGYNSFGNILFYGLGMYLCASVQVGMFFPLAEWTESGGEKTFVHTPAQFFQGIGVGLAVAAIVPAIVAGLIGYSILGLRGHYFAICTLGLGVAAGEISGGIEIIGAGTRFYNPTISKYWKPRSKR